MKYAACFMTGYLNSGSPLEIDLGTHKTDKMTTFKTDIVAEMRPGDVVEIETGDPEECSTYHTLAWRYSKIKGKMQGKYIHTSIDYETCTVWLVCTTYDEYLRERDRLMPKGWWKSLIRKKKPEFVLQ